MYKTFTPLLFLLICPLTVVVGQIDFFGRPLTSQSPNSANRFVIAGLNHEGTLASNAVNLKDFDHATRQIDLFNLGISYATQVLNTSNASEIQINLDTVVGGPVTKGMFRLFAGMQYEAWDRQTSSMALIGGSRFRDGGLSVAIRHEMSLLPIDGTWELIPATVRDESLVATVFIGAEAGYDTGFRVTLEETGIMQLVTDHLVRDVAAGRLTFNEYKTIEERLHESLRYEAPRSTGGSEWYLLAIVKGQMQIQPFQSLPLQFSAGLEVGVDVVRLRKRNQSRFGFFVGAAVLLY